MIITHRRKLALAGCNGRYYNYRLDAMSASCNSIVLASYSGRY